MHKHGNQRNISICFIIRLRKDNITSVLVVSLKVPWYKGKVSWIYCDSLIWELELEFQLWWYNPLVFINGCRFVEYAWFIWQGKNCRQFRLLTWNFLIDQFIKPIGGDGIKIKVDGRGNRYFSPLRDSLY